MIVRNAIGTVPSNSRGHYHHHNNASSSSEENDQVNYEKHYSRFSTLLTFLSKMLDDEYFWLQGSGDVLIPGTPLLLLCFTPLCK